MLRWQVNIASGAYLVVVQFQGLLILNDPSYVFERWHGTLLIIAVTIVALSFNTFLAKRLPLIEGSMLIIHSCDFFAILSFTVATLLSSYIISISCILLKCSRDEAPLIRRWSLGWRQTPLNVVAVIYLSLAYLLLYGRYDACRYRDFSWRVPISGGAVVFAFDYFGVHGRHVYDGPAVLGTEDN